ncbi:receptor-like protein EIX1 [Manihot esculenta]|uniref:receptor-like protein EIX1 n=1 Tax=Manihot esculenta TaxID=3983 RepID=UPI000B5D4141|nr:receptor-like protein EIX1 [Manihot esculenta]
MRSSESKELERGYCLENRLRQEEADVDQMLERLKEQLLAELGARDNSHTLLPTSSSFSRWIQQETIPKKLMMPPMAAYDGTENPKEYILNYKTFIKLQTHSDALMWKVVIGHVAMWVWCVSVMVLAVIGHVDLSGSSPVSIGHLCNLQTLNFNQNSLHREVTELHLSKLEALSELVMSGNSLVFDIAAKWIPPFQLYWIDLSSCILGPRFPQWLKTHKRIVYLVMSNASISDSIPNWFENISSTIEGLDLSYNQLFGSVPNLRKVDTLGNRFISLKFNKFDSLANFHTDAGESLSALKMLSLHSNKFEGEIPLQLCHLASLRMLNLANNMMTRTIPTCFGNFTVISTHENNRIWDYHTYALDGSFEGDVYGENLLVYVKGIQLEYTRILAFLYFIDLLGNNFVGEIPKELMNLLGLQNLNLSMNKLDGHIPWNIGKLSTLESLDLAKTELSGLFHPIFLI